MSFSYSRFLRSAVYEVNVRQYTPEGDFRAFRLHLPRLASMGVDILWFMPITPISAKGRKGSLGSYYACSDYTSVNPEFGTLEDFIALVSEAHRLGMKVIIDWVSNHTGLDHRWVEEHPGFYKRNEHGECFDAHGWDDVIDLDYTHAALRLEMIRCMQFWVDAAGIDGFRCDMAMLTPVDFWRQAREAIDPGRHQFWLAELDPLDNPPYMQVFDSAYTWRWMHAVTRFAEPSQRKIQPLTDILENYRALALWRFHPAWFTSNHDENSWNGTEYEKFREMALPLAVFCCLWPGIPLIYSGQEIPNKKRLAFFDKDPLQWHGTPALQGFYQKLLDLRRSHPAIGSGPVDILYASEGPPFVFSFLRAEEEHQMLVVLNLSDAHIQDFQVRDPRISGDRTELFTEQVRDFRKDASLHLQPWAYQVWTT